MDNYEADGLGEFLSLCIVNYKMLIVISNLHGEEGLNDLPYSRCNEMLSLDNKDCEEDALRLTGILSCEDPDLRYLLIRMPMTAKRLNPLLFPKLALSLLVEKRSKPLQLAVVCARAEARCRRDGGQSALLPVDASARRSQILSCTGSS